MKFHSKDRREAYKTAAVECAKACASIHSAINCIRDAKNQFDGVNEEEATRREFVVITDKLYDFSHALTASAGRFQDEREKCQRRQEMTPTEFLIKTLQGIKSDEHREKASSVLLDFMLEKILIAQEKGQIL